MLRCPLCTQELTNLKQYEFRNTFSHYLYSCFAIFTQKVCKDAYYAGATIHLYGL